VRQFTIKAVHLIVGAGHLALGIGHLAQTLLKLDEHRTIPPQWAPELPAIDSVARLRRDPNVCARGSGVSLGSSARGGVSPGYFVLWEIQSVGRAMMTRNIYRDKCHVNIIIVDRVFIRELLQFSK
jgi:hypothetical protein